LLKYLFLPSSISYLPSRNPNPNLKIISLIGQKIVLKLPIGISPSAHSSQILSLTKLLITELLQEPRHKPIKSNRTSNYTMIPTAPELPLRLKSPRSRPNNSKKTRSRLNYNKQTTKSPNPKMMMMMTIFLLKISTTSPMLHK